MTTPVRRRWRLLRRGAWYALAAALVLLALGNGIGSQLLPLVERHPDKVAAWLGVRVKGEVAFDHVDTEWTRRGPLLRLDNLRIGSGANPLRIGDAEILVAQYAGLLPGRSFTELRVRGLDLVLQRDVAGLWSVRGLPGQQQAGGDPFETLERLGELQVSHARLQVLAPELGLKLQVPRIDLRMRVDGSRIKVGANAWLRSGATPIAAALDFDRASGDGRVYAGTRHADLREFAGSFDLAGVAPASGKGRLHAPAVAVAPGRDITIGVELVHHAKPCRPVEREPRLWIEAQAQALRIGLQPGVDTAHARRIADRREMQAADVRRRSEGAAAQALQVHVFQHRTRRRDRHHRDGPRLRRP